jgi:hypothetical protein
MASAPPKAESEGISIDTTIVTNLDASIGIQDPHYHSSTLVDGRKRYLLPGPFHNPKSEFQSAEFMYNASVPRTLKGIDSHTADYKMLIAAPLTQNQLEQNDPTLRVDRSMILKNLPLHVEKAEIWSALSQYGPIEQISKLRRSNPQSMFCYATMQKIDDAKDLQHRGYFIFRGKRKVHVERFVPKEERNSHASKPDSNQVEQIAMSTIEVLIESRSTASIHENANQINSKPHGKSCRKPIATEALRGSDKTLSLIPKQDSPCNVSKSKEYINIRHGLKIQMDTRCYESLPFSYEISSCLYPIGCNREFALRDSILDPNRNLRFNIQSSSNLLPLSNVSS